MSVNFNSATIWSIQLCMVETSSIYNNNKDEINKIKNKENSIKFSVGKHFFEEKNPAFKENLPIAER